MGVAMVVFCEECERHYDDARCWTICPHNPLYRGASDRVCKRHDLFACDCDADKIMVFLRAHHEKDPGVHLNTALITQETGLSRADTLTALDYLWRLAWVKRTGGMTIDTPEHSIDVGLCWGLTDHVIKEKR